MNLDMHYDSYYLDKDVPIRYLVGFLLDGWSKREDTKNGPTNV